MSRCTDGGYRKPPISRPLTYKDARAVAEAHYRQTGVYIEAYYGQTPEQWIADVRADAALRAAWVQS
jgi:hypothetical protein